jgi:hypothetical protein
MEKSLFLVEGMADAVFNDYVRKNIDWIFSVLHDKGVLVEKFKAVSPDVLDKDSLKRLVLRQQPMLSADEAERMALEYMNGSDIRRRSRLMFIADVVRDECGNCVAKVFCEDGFGETMSEFLLKLLSFLDDIAAYYEDKKPVSVISTDFRFRMPEGECDALCGEDNFDCLCDDILAGAVCGCENIEVSPICFDDDFNITLPLYPNVTITLEPLPKTLYILFLHHPEGVVLKDIQLYEAELKRIYSNVSGRKNPTVIKRVLRSLIDPTENPLHKNLSIIRRSFTSKLNYNIARNYIPTHGRTKAHNIPLESEYVILPEIA